MNGIVACDVLKIFIIISKFLEIETKLKLRYITHLGHAVAQLIGALRYKPEGRGFDSRRCHWNFSLT